MIDAHCHLDAPELGDPEATVAEARAAGVEQIVMAGVDPANWDAQAALVRRFERRFPVHAVFGLHPQIVAMMDERGVADALADLERRLSASDGVRPVALGELGVDRYTDARKAALGLQLEAFRAQLRLAIRLDLPIVLHLLRADEQALKVLKDEGVPRAGGLVHSYSGSADFARQLARWDLHISFCGTLTFPQSRRLREAALAVPEERLLIETDSPDQPPVPHRGAVNRPAFLPAVLSLLAELRVRTVDAMASITAANTRRLLRL